MNYEATREFAQKLDQADPLGSWRDQFRLPLAKDGRDCVYFCGNSLGLQPKRAARFVEEELDSWARHGINGHFTGTRPWLSYHRYATKALAELTGARSDEVIAMNTLTVNLHLLMASFYRPDESRYKIIIESTAFPSDRYAVVSQLRMHQLDPHDALIEWAPRAGGTDLQIDDLQALLEQHGSSTALILLPGVQYYNGQVLDMQRLCELAKEAQCTLGLDLAHAIGNVPLELHEWAPDFAAWCSYKYLNGGPGAVAGAFVHQRHLSSDAAQPLLGWWGNSEKTCFQMAKNFDPADGIESWQLSNPPVLALAPVVASLEMFVEAGLDKLCEKSKSLSGYLDYLLREQLADRVTTITPIDARGCQLSLTITDIEREPKAVFAQLDGLNVIVDWREPDAIRAAPAPFYNGFEDAFEFVQRLKIAIEGRR